MNPNITSDLLSFYSRVRCSGIAAHPFIRETGQTPHQFSKQKETDLTCLSCEIIHYSSETNSAKKIHQKLEPRSKIIYVYFIPRKVLNLLDYSRGVSPF